MATKPLGWSLHNFTGAGIAIFDRERKSPLLERGLHALLFRFRNPALKDKSLRPSANCTKTSSNLNLIRANLGKGFRPDFTGAFSSVPQRFYNTCFRHNLDTLVMDFRSVLNYHAFSRVTSQTKREFAFLDNTGLHKNA